MHHSLCSVDRNTVKLIDFVEEVVESLFTIEGKSEISNLPTSWYCNEQIATFPLNVQFNFRMKITSN